MLNRRPRRQMNQMNVVPYIDVMLVLLVIFMVTTPLFTPGVIDVPSVARARALDTPPVEVALDGSGSITVQSNEQKQTFDSISAFREAIPTLGNLEQPFAISAAKDMKYADVLAVADALHQAGVKRVALTVKQT